MRKIPTLFERDWDGDRSRVVSLCARSSTGPETTTTEPVFPNTNHQEARPK